MFVWCIIIDLYDIDICIMFYMLIFVVGDSIIVFFVIFIVVVLKIDCLYRGIIYKFGDVW